MRKRGCQDCAHVGRKASGWLGKGCPYKECPYKVLDKYNTYEEYLASDESKIKTPQFFMMGSEYCKIATRKKDTRNRDPK